MKRIIIASFGVLLAFWTLAQQEETRSLSSFDEVSAQEGIDVYLEKGSSETARVVTERIDLDDVLTEVSGGRLKIHIDGNKTRNINVQVYVTFVSLEALAASSAASIEVEDPIETDGEFEVDVSSAGNIEATISAESIEIDASSSGDADLEVDVEEVDAEVSSSGEIKISGTAINQEVQTSSAGRYEGFGLQSEEANVSSSSGSSARVSCSRDLDASASSGASIRYKGDPKYVNVNNSSGGSVRRD